MYEFLPYLPTKIAWNNRMFSDQPTLNAVLETMAAKKIIYKGQLVLHDGKYITFGHINELKTFLKDIPEKTLSMIYLYGLGSFRHR